MFNDVENIKLLFTSNKERKNHHVNNRKGHVLIFRTSGCGFHDFGDKIIKSPTGSITFVPEGSSYTFQPLGDEPCRSVCVTFLADIRNAKPITLDGNKFLGLQNTALNIYDYFKLHSPYSKYKCQSLLYSVFASLVSQESSNYSNQRKYQIIKPAVDYINNHLSNSHLKTDTLHCLCGISPAYFRRIFKANLRMSPQKYIEEKRLQYALSLINEHTYSISKISKMVGYNDPLYFGKVFKMKYGISPSHIPLE